jgi:hypothetical protein
VFGYGPERADIAQSVEHFLGKEEVMGSNPIVSSTFFDLGFWFYEKFNVGDERHGKREV